jgi:RNA polymerase sigma factor (sigma-70 family)
MPIAHALPPPLDSPVRLLGRPWLDSPRRSTFQTMPAAPTTDPADAALAVEEARLAHAAADGDGGAFASLYERYERRAYNLAYRVTGSEDDAADAVQDAFLNVMRRLPRLQGRDLVFGSYLFTATRNACYDLMAKRKRAEPSDSIPESAAPVGAGAGGLGLDPGDPDDDPDRRLLLASQQEEIRTANARLPERQREALALRELEELSYDEIAAIMEMNRNSVAQLISRARINLRDELRGTALASIAVSSPDCERALPLIAMREDGQLADEDDATWLATHLAGCDTCTLGLEAMQEAGTSYRAWAPIAAAPWLFEETMAKAAELTGSDWTAAIAEHAGRRSQASALPGMPNAYLAGSTAVAEAGSGRRRRRLLVAATLTAALLIAVVTTTVLGDDDPQPPPVEPAAETVASPPEQDAAPEKRKPEKRKAKKRDDGDSPTPDADRSADGGQQASGGETASDPPAADPQPKPRQPATRTPDPLPEAPTEEPPPPVVDEPPVVEEPPDAPPIPPRGGGQPTAPG